MSPRPPSDILTVQQRKPGPRGPRKARITVPQASGLSLLQNGRVDRLSAVGDVYQQWERRNYRAGLDLYDPAITLEVHTPIPEAGVYEGLEGLQRYMRGFLETWDVYEIHATELEADGDLVIVDVHHRGRASEALVEMDYITVWTFQGDRVARMDIGRDRERLVAAASRHLA